MGTDNSKQAPPSRTFSPEIQVLDGKPQVQFSEAKIVKDVKTGKQMYLKKIVLHDKDALHERLQYFYNRVRTPHPNLVNVVGYTSDEHHAFCATDYIIDLYLDFLSKNMETEFESRVRTGELFSEVELQLLCEHLISVLAEFQNQGISHGDIRPASIYVNEEAHKLCDPMLERQRDLNGISRYLLLGIKSLLAPELVKQIPASDNEIRTNKFKADVFSLGATMLSLATLTRSEDLYNYEQGGFNLNLMEARIKSAEDIYSPVFIKLLKELLTINEKERPDFVQLKDRLHVGELIKSYYIKDQHPTNLNKVPYLDLVNHLADNGGCVITDNTGRNEDEAPDFENQRALF